MNSHTIKCQNIKCDGCISKINEALGNITGISALSVDKATQSVSFSGDDAVCKAAEEKLKELGFLAKKGGIFSKIFS